MIRKIISIIVLLGVGLMQMFGDIIDSDVIKAIGFATCASPKQKVFTSHNGYETFSADFKLSYYDSDNQQQELLITPKNYKNIKGPYNRRNMYGAGLSYAPVLANNPKTKNMFASVSSYALCKKAPILNELKINSINNNLPINIILSPKQQSIQKDQWQLIYEVNCSA